MGTVRHFVQTRKAGDFDEEGQDARALGTLLAADVGAKMRTAAEGRIGPDAGMELRLSRFIDRASVLRDMRTRYHWYPTLLLEVLRNRIRAPAACRKDLKDYTEEDAGKTGRGLRLSLAANMHSEAAINEWSLTYVQPQPEPMIYTSRANPASLAHRYPAMGQLEGLFSWVRPMMEAVAVTILAQVSWGVKLRAYLGASVSIFDLLSDG
jgi:hypothetical protein